MPVACPVEQGPRTQWQEDRAWVSQTGRYGWTQGRDNERWRPSYFTSENISHPGDMKHRLSETWLWFIMIEGNDVILGSGHGHWLNRLGLGTATTICPTAKPRLSSTWQHLWKDQQHRSVLTKAYLPPWKGQRLIMIKTYSKCIFSFPVLTASANFIFWRLGWLIRNHTQKILNYFCSGPLKMEL